LRFLNEFVGDTVSSCSRMWSCPNVNRKGIHCRRRFRH
jgi:hypothetical protein